MSSEQWKKENTLQIGVRINNTTGIPAAFQKAISDAGINKNTYIIEAIREKLIRDGYDPENYKPKK